MNRYVRNLNRIEFIVTMACTGKCRHCSEGDHAGFTGHMDADTADKYFRDLWLVAYGFTTMIAIGECPYTDEQISAIFTEFSLSICKAYKEIPGLPEGNYDRDQIFSQLVSK